MNCTLKITLVLTLIAASTSSQDTAWKGSRTGVTDGKRVDSDRHALNAIFEDSHIADDALAIHHRAMRMPPEERYEFLSRWVLPNADHATIRTALDFTATQPAPPVQSAERTDIDRLRFAEQSRVQTGGRLVAPAIDFVEVAKTLGRLEEIRSRVDQFLPSNAEQQRARLAMLSAVDTARGNFESAQRRLEDLFQLVQTGEHSSFLKRCPETFAISMSLPHPENRDIVRAMLFQIVSRQLRRNVRSGVPAWETHIQAMWRQSNDLDTGTADVTSPSQILEQWHGTNRVLAVSRGSGSPHAQWHVSAGRVDNVAIHSDDYLFFQSPLRGNFEVECDVSALPWESTTIYVAGKWVSPFYTHNLYKLGNVRGEQPRRPILPKLSKPRVWFRYRATIRDNVCKTYINGRRIHVESLPPDHEPWLAIRSVLRNAGATRDVRITGDPVIPESVRLSTSRELPGWMPYSNRSVMRPEGDWRQYDEAAYGGGIVGRHQADRAGTGLESLFYYVRPMLEDGEIEYDFYYSEGEAITHPALDRLAFILDRRGVRIHWVTDDQYDRTGLDPMNVADEPQNRRGPANLPFKGDAWNRLQLSLSGHTVRLFLNGQEVYERKLEATNQRRFGLFHYADRTEARVRNIVWKGNWPRELPPVSDQELAIKGSDILDADLPKLTAVFKHNFATDGLPSDRFTVVEDGWQDSVATRPDGVHVTRTGEKNRFLQYSLVPRCTVKGDFDVTASYRNLEPAPQEGTEETKCSVILSAVLRDKAQTRTYLYRRHVRMAGRDDDRLVQGSFNATVDGQTRRTYFGTVTFEAESGTLRLARRGKKMYFLVAEHDSSNFRLIGEEILSDADLHPEGIRLHTQVAGPGSCGVVWTKVAISATEIIDLAADSRAKTIAKLQQQLTGKLPSNALEFDGRTQFVTVPSIKYDGSHPITLEAYVTHDRLGSIVVGDTQRSGLAIGVPSEQYNMHAWNGTNYNAAVSADKAVTNVRVHIAGTFDGQKLAVFVNGKLLKESPLKGNFVPSGFPLTIGASPSPGEAGLDYAFAGLIDAVRISSTVRYTKSFEPPVTLTSDDESLAVYLFDEARGETLNDSSGNRHHGAVRGATWVSSSAIRHRAGLGLVKFGRHSVGVLTKALMHQEAAVRIEAALALGMIGKDATPAIPALKKLAADKHREAAEAARQAVARIEGIAFFEALLRVFK